MPGPEVEPRLPIERGLPLDPLTAISPIDGRYAEQTKVFRGYFSEYALIRGRVYVEIKYLLALPRTGIIRPFSPEQVAALDGIWQNFSLEDARRVKEIERKTRHDVKSMEYYIKEKLPVGQIESDIFERGLIPNETKELVHFGLTSEDPTNLSQNLYIARAKDEILVPTAWDLVDGLCKKADEWKNVAMVGRTHGRKAVPTTFGKELALFARRLALQTQELSQTKLTGKLTGAVGNFNELVFAALEVDWVKFSGDFVSSLGLEPQLFTTQIEPHDRWAEIFQNVARMNTIVKSLTRNMWGYLSHDYFVLPPREGQAGSSVMPQKGRNPIDFENAEGNTILANALLKEFAEELPDSRFQRHLSDSTIARNIGVAFAHTFLGWGNALSDLKDAVLNEEAVTEDLRKSWGSVTAGLQTRLRRIGVERPYEQIDELAKAGPMTKERLRGFINGLPIDVKEKDYLNSLEPLSYLGAARRLTEMMLKEIDQMRPK